MSSDAAVEALLSRLVRVAPRSSGSGFWSGVLVGGGLGFVYAPCAGPILAAVVSVSATQGASGRLVAVALGYAAGSALVLLAIAYGGRRVLDVLRRRGRGLEVQRALGVVMLVTAVAVGTNLDVRFQTLLANHVPTFLVNPTHALERSAAVEDRLATLRGRSRFDSARAAETPSGASDGSPLPVLGKAPDFQGTERWFINCLRTLPAVRAWDRRYRHDGLTIVGVHTPEFSFEHDPANVSQAIAQNQIRYPVAQDNRYATWNAWGNQYWPAKYLVDARGRVRYTHFGEGGDDKTEHAIRTLLTEAGAHALGRPAHARTEAPSAKLATPETYLGVRRAQGWAGKPPTIGSGSYPVVGDP